MLLTKANDWEDAKSCGTTPEDVEPAMPPWREKGDQELHSKLLWPISNMPQDCRNPGLTWPLRVLRCKAVGLRPVGFYG